MLVRDGGEPMNVFREPGREVVLDVPLEKGGVYAVRIERQLDHLWIVENLDSPTLRPTFARVEGRSPTGLRPVGAPTTTRRLGPVVDSGQLRGRTPLVPGREFDALAHVPRVHPAWIR